MIRVACVIALVGVVGCAASLTQRARRAIGDPDRLVTRLEHQFDEIDATKRIFAVTLIEGRRRFAGDGAVVFRSEPRRMVVDVFGPHDTHVVHLDLVGDSLTVDLPQDGEILSGRLGDPVFVALTGERAFASPEVLGALLGAYDIGPLARGADRLSATRDRDRSTLFIERGDIVHAFEIEEPDGRLVDYQQERAGRLVYRVRFSEFEVSGELESPRKVVLRDYIKERQLVLDVRSQRDPDRDGA